MIDGPSPLEIARSPVGWWVRSEEFYTAGEALFQIQQENYDKYYLKHVGKQVTPEAKTTIRLLKLSTPIIFNLAFSCELLLKAILVSQDPEKWVPNKGPVKFGHNIYSKICEETDISLNELETKIAKRIGEYISYGKYPERAKPGNIQESFKDLFDFHPYVNWSINEYFDIITSLRNKLKSYFLELQ